MSETEKDKAVLVNFRLPESVLKAFDLKHSGDGKRAEALRFLINQDLKEPGVPTDFNGEAKRAERLKLLNFEDKLWTVLTNEEVIDGFHKRYSASDALHDFGRKNGMDEHWEKGIDKVLEMLIVGEAPFRGRPLETMIEYVETILARRKLDAEIKKMRNKQSTVTTNS